MSNNAPKCKWVAHHMNDTHSRLRLYVNGAETPFWVDVAHTIGHRTHGEKYGLWGSGMGKMTSAGYRIAGCLGCGPKIAPLKHRAEQMAMEAFA